MAGPGVLVIAKKEHLEDIADCRTGGGPTEHKKNNAN